MATCLDFLIEGKDLDRNAPEAAKIYQRDVIAEFFRLTFDKNFPSHKEEGTDEVALQYKKLIELEAQVLKALYLLIFQLYKLNKLPYTEHNHPILVFFQLVVERQIALFSYIKDAKKEKIETATEWRKINQHLNRFSEKMSGLTGKVMKTARALADKDDEFRKKVFNPLMNARKTLLAFSRQNHSILRRGKYAIPVRQGRGQQKSRRKPESQGKS